MAGSEIPSCYGDNRIVLMIRDPLTLFTYWEVRENVEDNTRSEISSLGLTPSKSVLRVMDLTDDEDKPEIFSDYELRGWAMSWYVHTGRPGRKWKVAIGILCSTGEFFALAESNVVVTPSDRLSDLVDGDWMSKELLEKHLEGAFSTVGFSSGMFGRTVPTKEKG